MEKYIIILKLKMKMNAIYAIYFALKTNHDINQIIGEKKSLLQGITLLDVGLIIVINIR